MRPDWQEAASEHEAAVGTPRDHEADQRTVDELNARIEQAEAVPDETASLGEDGPDYVVLRRWIPATKGKWRLVSREVEDAGREG